MALSTLSKACRLSKAKEVDDSGAWSGPTPEKFVTIFKATLLEIIGVQSKPSKSALKRATQAAFKGELDKTVTDYWA